MNVCACDRKRYILDVSEPFPSRFQLSSSTLLLTEHSGWERRQTSTHNHLLHFRRTIFIILRVLTIFAHTQIQHTCSRELLRTLPVAKKYLLCLKALWVISVIVSHLLFLAFCLSFSLFISLFLFFVSVESLLRLQECVCWSRDEGWSVHRHVTGKITTDKRVLMKGAGPSPAVFGVECCQGLWGASLWVLSPCWKVETAGSISRRNACAKKLNFAACVEVDSQQWGERWLWKSCTLIGFPHLFSSNNLKCNSLVAVYNNYRFS